MSVPEKKFEQKYHTNSYEHSVFLRVMFINFGFLSKKFNVNMSFFNNNNFSIIVIKFLFITKGFD